MSGVKDVFLCALQTPVQLNTLYKGMLDMVMLGTTIIIGSFVNIEINLLNDRKTFWIVHITAYISTIFFNTST